MKIVIHYDKGKDLIYCEYEEESKPMPELTPESVKPSIEEEILFETKYQTLLIEMGGM